MSSKTIIYTFGLVAIFTLALVQCMEIHEETADAEFIKVSSTKQENEYNHLKQTRETTSRYLNDLGKTIDHYLNPKDGILIGADTPVWHAFTGSDGKPQYKRMRKGIVELAVAFWKLRRLMDHSIHRRSVDDFSSSIRSAGDHFFGASKKSGELQEGISEELERTVRDITQHLNGTNKSTRKKRPKRNIVFPSLLIITAYKEENQSQSDLSYLDDIVYQIAFWNAVDLRFRQVSNPIVRLRIAGIIIGQDAGATPYISNENGIELMRSLFNMSSYWNEMMNVHPEFPRGAYHAVITMTDYKMNVPNTNEHLMNGILGTSFVSSLCSPDALDAMAIIHDNGRFDGHITAVEKLARIMGLAQSGGIGDNACQSDYEDEPEKSTIFHLAECTLKQISTFLRKPRLKCVEQPAEFYPPGNPVEKILPGDIMNDHEQCKGQGNDWACGATPETCQRLMCYDSGFKAFIENRWKCEGSIPAAEGTTCGPSMKCLMGTCVCTSEECLSDPDVGYDNGNTGTRIS